MQKLERLSLSIFRDVKIETRFSCLSRGFFQIEAPLIPRPGSSSKSSRVFRPSTRARAGNESAGNRADRCHNPFALVCRIEKLWPRLQRHSETAARDRIFRRRHSRYLVPGGSQTRAIINQNLIDKVCVDKNIGSARTRNQSDVRLRQYSS